ncbi:MAG: hypothetical protein IPM51_05670 [Sphingobacteriaceae bacterium]|nr:hypothetical protein [Sphingobacteriaceae bacterium]
MAEFYLQSEAKKTKASLENLFEFLSDFKNFESILPSDKVEGFTYTEIECSFVIKGITPMKVNIDEKVPHKYIKFKSEGLGKFNFRLKTVFIGESSQSGECLIEMHGDLNPIILNMAKASLEQLINTMAHKLGELNEHELKPNN